MLNKFCNKQLSRAISVLLSLCLMLTGAIVMGTIASAEENIITNGGFETGDHTGWNNGANAEIVSNEHHSGSHSLRLVCRRALAASSLLALDAGLRLLFGCANG